MPADLAAEAGAEAGDADLLVLHGAVDQVEGATAVTLTVVLLNICIHFAHLNFFILIRI